MLAVADHRVFCVFHGLLEIPLQKALEGAAVTGLVAGHFMDGVMDGIEAILLRAGGQLNLACGGAEFAVDTPGQVVLRGGLHVRLEVLAEQLKANFNGECSEVGMYLCMARIAHREGYPEIGLYWEKAAYEEAEHAAKFAELLGEVVTDSTRKNLEMRVEAENGATAGKFELAKKAKQLNLDAIHDTVHEMARDEARHGKAFEGLLKRYFGK